MSAGGVLVLGNGLQPDIEVPTVPGDVADAPESLSKAFDGGLGEDSGYLTQDRPGPAGCDPEIMNILRIAVGDHPFGARLDSHELVVKDGPKGMIDRSAGL
jgi:hypothetical protein